MAWSSSLMQTNVARHGRSPHIAPPPRCTAADRSNPPEVTMRKLILGSRTLACALVATTALSCASGSGAARPSKPASPRGAAASPGVQAVDAVALANGLAAHGRATSSPLALL